MKSRPPSLLPAVRDPEQVPGGSPGTDVMKKRPGGSGYRGAPHFTSQILYGRQAAEIWSLVRLSPFGGNSPVKNRSPVTVNALVTSNPAIVQLNVPRVPTKSLGSIGIPLTTTFLRSINVCLCLPTISTTRTSTSTAEQLAGAFPATSS